MMDIAQLPEFPFTPQFAEINGHKIAYLDEGSGPVLVLAHGNPTWSYLFRNLVQTLRGRYRCIVPDHLGCGLSDKPQDNPPDTPYRLATHIDNLEALLEQLGITDCGLILHDWGGAIGMGWAVRHPERVRAITACNTAAFRSENMPKRIALARVPLFGDLAVRGGNAFAWAATRMAVRKKMRPDIAAAFTAPYDSWANRIATLRFVQDVPMNPAHPSWDTLSAIDDGLAQFADTPLLLCWGGSDFCFGRDFYEEWHRRFPRAEAHWFPEAGHYLFEDAGEAIFPLIGDFFDRHFLNRAEQP